MKDGTLSAGAITKRPRLRPVPPMAPEASRRVRGSTAAAQVHQILRNEILSMFRKPGEPINDRAIEAALGVSRTPIREAILRLAAENLVEIQPQSGTFVARIPLAVLPEAVAIRKALEDLNVRSAAGRASPAQVASLRAILDRQREWAAACDPMGFYAADEMMHATIAEIAGYPSSWPLVLKVKVQVDRYCHLTLPQPGRMQRLLNEHLAIVEAIADHDVEAARAALERHLDGIMAGLELSPDFDPNFFIGNPRDLPHSPAAQRLRRRSTERVAD